uniref:Uncharacterized protein n=1 Tax=Fagus sylvatica TaxID=28930 RepID=A0A2N9GTX3_FAGSY
MAGETSGPGPSEQEIRMVALERKFDELLSFVQLIAKRNTDDENQRKEDDKDTSEAEPEGHSNTNATPPRPPTPPKPEGKDSQLDSKIDSLEEKIRLIQGLNSFGNTDFSSMSWFPNMTVPPKFKAPEFEKYNGRGDPMIHLQMYCRKMAPYADNEPLLIQTFQDTLTGNAAEWYSQLKKISHWKELADTFLAQYGFNSQIAPDRFDLQRMEKKSNETFREYAQRWREKAARARPPLDEREMIKIFVDTLKNPYFDRMMGLQMQFFVDLIPVGERIEDALKTKKIVDMTALMALAEQAAKKAPTKRKEGDVQMIGRSNGRPRQILPTFTMQSVQPRPTPTPAPTQVPAPAPAPQVPARPEKKYHQKEAVNQMTPPSFDWYAEINLDDIVEDEMDLDNLQDEEADWGYFMEDDTDEWRDVDFTEFFQFPCLIVPPGFVTPEFEIFYENGDPEVHLQKYGEKMALHLGERAFDDLALTEGRRRGKSQVKATTTKQSSPPPLAEEEYAGPMVEGLSIHTIAGEEDSTTTPPTRHCQQGEEAKTWTCVPLLQRVSKPREVKIGTRCAAEQKEALIALLREFHEIFAWSYQDMPGLDTDIVVHKIPLKPECKPVKQALRRMKPEVILKIKEEVEKQLKAGFLSTVTYSDWVANIVPVPKKDGKVRMCVDYRDLNRASPKDNFPLPHIDTLVDNTATNVVFSFMDGFSGYNQIKMAEEDKSKTAFITHWGTFVYDVMPFGLKNAGATYQRAMVTLFHDMIHHEIEVYVDDMIAKSRTAQDHLTDLRKLFQRLKKYQLRLNPNKCAFGVTSGKLLGFIVSGRGIEIDPAKVQAIRSMPAPKTEKEIRSFLGRINYIARFIAQLTGDLRASVQVVEKRRRPLILYLTVQEASMGCMLGQQDETGKKEQAIYYLSKKFTEPETRYLLVEKTCCALAWASKKLRQYMLYYTTWLVSRMDPIKYIFEKPALTGKIARWQVLLSEFDILFVARKAIKGQAIADYLADYPSEQLELMDSEFPDEDVMTVDEDNHGRWKLYFDGAANAVGSGIGAVLVSPKGQQTPIAVKLGFDCTNNMTEYEACITNGEWQARDPKLIPYQRYISRLVPKFKYVTFTYTPRAHNHFADALATLASLIKLVEGDDVRPLRIETRDIPAYCVCIEECMNVEAEIDNKPWYYDIKRFIQDREYPPRATENEKKYIRRMAFQFFLSGEILYKRTHDATLLRCVDAEEANRLIQGDARGIDGSPCQRTLPGPEDHESCKNAPPQYLHTMASPWPFSAWGMDVIGAITPKASNGHEFILVAIDYFTKWVEACSFKNVTQVAVTRFVKNNIICRYGMPEMLITDNASNLNNRMMDQLCQQFKIQHHNSAPYRPKMNGAVEAANKNVKKILSKMTETYKDWHEHLPYALCAYRTSVRTSVGATPYSLVYGMEAVLPVEVEIPSLRILSQTQLEEAEWAQARYEQLNFIDEKRLAALCHGQLYQRRIERAYNKKARPRTFQPGDLVLKKRNMALSDPRGKFAPSYEGPYVVKKAFSGGAIILADMDGEEFRSPINSDSVIKYHV